MEANLETPKEPMPKLKDRIKTQVEGSLRRGQLWLRSMRGSSLELAWNLWSSMLHSTVAIGGQHDVVIALALPPGSLRLSLDRLIPAKLLPKEGRNFGISVYNGTVYVDLWSNRARFSTEDPWWQRLSFSPLDLVLGRAEQSERLLEESVSRVKLPEGRYQVVVRMVETSWTRPRWPFPVTLIRAHIRVIGRGIPVPGTKGGEELIPELTCVTSSAKKAVKKMSEFIATTRSRKGGEGWEPKSAPPERPRSLKKRKKLRRSLEAEPDHEPLPESEPESEPEFHDEGEEPNL